MILNSFKINPKELMMKIDQIYFASFPIYLIRDIMNSYMDFFIYILKSRYMLLSIMLN